MKTGWFGSEAELIRAAILEFVQRNRIDLLERFMRDHIRVGRSDPRIGRSRIVVCDTGPALHLWEARALSRGTDAAASDSP